MNDWDCIFCKIISGEIPSVKIWEDEDFLAILDGFPNCRWQALVMTKHHFDSDIFLLEIDLYSRYLLAVKKVVEILKTWLKVQKIGLVMEGLWVNHAHFKLYPMHGVTGEWKANVWWQEVFFDQYPGYLTSEMGPQADREELKKIAEEIIGNT